MSTYETSMHTNKDEWCKDAVAGTRADPDNLENSIVFCLGEVHAILGSFMC
jgi:hypothetical protein